MALFDRFIFVDWSANSTPKTGKDSIWIAEASDGATIRLINPSTRNEATQSVLRSLQQAVDQKQRVLVGTRTPAAIVFENLEDGMTLDEVMEQFPVTQVKGGARVRCPQS